MVASGLTEQSSLLRYTKVYLVPRIGSFITSPHTRPHRIISQLFHRAASSGSNDMSGSEV